MNQSPVCFSNEFQWRNLISTKIEFVIKDCSVYVSEQFPMVVGEKRKDYCCAERGGSKDIIMVINGLSTQKTGMS